MYIRRIEYLHVYQTDFVGQANAGGDILKNLSCQSNVYERGYLVV